MTVIEELRSKLAQIAEQKGILNEGVLVKVKPLSTEQAIGTPERNDFPLQKGKERIIEARFMDSPGQAFTDSFRDYQSDVAGLLALDLNDPFNASLFVAASNAVLRHLGLTDKTVHCRNQEPALCAPQLLEYLAQKHPSVRKVALVGMQPAMAEALARVYDLTILDLDPENIGRENASTRICDGRRDLERVAEAADLLLCTGSTLSNNTIDGIRQAAGERPLVFFGITISGAASLLGLERFCPLGH